MISRTRWIFLIFAVCIFSSTASARNISADTTFKDTLSVARDTLNPKPDSLAAVKDTTSVHADTIVVKKDTLDIITSEANLYTVPGFRIQILATQSLQDAVDVKTEAQNELTNFNVYLVYDPPYYKVRVGDFKARYEANQAGNYISAHGYPDAWTVPDNVFRNPALKK